MHAVMFAQYTVQHNEQQSNILPSWLIATEYSLSMLENYEVCDASLASLTVEPVNQLRSQPKLVS